MKIKWSFALLLTVMLVACTGNNPPVREPQSTDALYTEEAAMSVYDHDPELALQIIDSAEMVGNLTSERASLVRAKVFSYNYEGARLDSAQQICMTLWNGDDVKNEALREEVLDLLVSISRKKHDIELWLRWTMEKADFCRKQGDEVETLRTEAEIGVILSLLGRTDEGLAKLDEVIEQLDGTGSVNRLDASIVAMRRKINVLNANDRPEEIIPIANRIVEKLNHYEQYPDQYANDSYRLLPDSADRADYIDFCRTQAYGYLAEAYAHDPTLADSTRHYLALFEQSDYGHSLAGRRTIAPTWIATGEYAKALAVYDEVTVLMDADTVNSDYATMLRGRAIAADATGDTRAASDYWRRYAALKQVLNDQLQQSEAHEYAARYRAYEQQMEIDRQSMQIRMKNFILLAVLVAFLLSTSFAIYTVYQKRKLAQKNAALAKLIDEKEEQKTVSSIPAERTKEDLALFQQMDQRIRKEHLYADLGIQRDEIAETLGMRRETINQLLNKFAGGVSIPTYLNNIRLSEACKMLREQPELTVSAVADQVGLTLRNLQRLFREQYGMSPSEYRLSHE